MENKTKMEFFKWTKKKPKFDQECLVIYGKEYDEEWTYSIYEIRRVVFDEKWYFAAIDQYGEENAPDMRADIYYVMPLITGTKKQFKNA